MSHICCPKKSRVFSIENGTFKRTLFSRLFPPEFKIQPSLFVLFCFVLFHTIHTDTHTLNTSIHPHSNLSSIILLSVTFTPTSPIHSLTIQSIIMSSYIDDNNSSDVISLTHSMIQKFESDFNNNSTRHQISNIRLSPTQQPSQQQGKVLSPRKKSLNNFNNKTKLNDKLKNPFHSIFNKRKQSTITSSSPKLPSINNKPMKSTSDRHEKIVLFDYPKVKITSYENTKSNSMNNNDSKDGLSGTLLSNGYFEIYKISTSNSNLYYLSNGYNESLIIPILSRLKIIKINPSSIILLIHNPERYWKITFDLGDTVDKKTTNLKALNQLDQLLLEICDFKNLSEDLQFVASDNSNNNNNIKNNILNDYETTNKKTQITILNDEQIDAKIKEDRSDSDKSDDTVIEGGSPIIPNGDMQKSKSFQSINSMNSEVACFNLNDDVHDKLESNDKTNYEEEHEDNEESDDIITPLLKHPTPLRPSSSSTTNASSLDSILDSFELEQEAENDNELSDDDDLNKSLEQINSLSRNRNTGYLKESINLQIDTENIKEEEVDEEENSSWMDPNNENDNDEYDNTTTTATSIVSSARFPRKQRNQKTSNHRSLSKRYSLTFKQFDDYNKSQSSADGDTSDINMELSLIMEKPLGLIVYENESVDSSTSRLNGMDIIKCSRTYSNNRIAVNTANTANANGTGTWTRKIFGW